MERDCKWVNLEWAATVVKAKQIKKHLKLFLIIKESVMTILALLCLAGLAFEYFSQLTTSQLLLLDAFEIAVGVIFLAEFGFELYFAKDRKSYWRYHWYFLIASVPVPMQTFDILRGIRALRLLRVFKVFAHLRYEHNTRLFEPRRP